MDMRGGGASCRGNSDFLVHIVFFVTLNIFIGVMSVCPWENQTFQKKNVYIYIFLSLQDFLIYLKSLVFPWTYGHRGMFHEPTLVAGRQITTYTHTLRCAEGLFTSRLNLLCCSSETQSESVSPQAAGKAPHAHHTCAWRGSIVPWRRVSHPESNQSACPIQSRPSVL